MNPGGLEVVQVVTQAEKALGGTIAIRDATVMSVTVKHSGPRAEVSVRPMRRVESETVD
jgi:hypothetical protein